MKKACLLGVLLLSLSLVGCSSSNNPSGVVKDFMKYTADGKMNEAVNLVTEQGQGLVTAFFPMMTAEIKKKGGIKAIDIIKEEITGDTATVTHIVKYGNGSTDEDSSKLTKQDGKWKLHVSK